MILAVVFVTLAVTGCVGADLIARARRKCWNDMQMAATRADSVAVLNSAAYQSVADGVTVCAHIVDSLPQRKP